MLQRFHGTSTVNENDVFSEEIQEEQNMEDDVLSVHSNLKADEMERIQIKKVELAFDKRSVVFRVNHDIRGKILKVNRAIYQSFGYTALELSGQVSITTLMPRIYSNIHPTLMQNFAQTGKTKTLYSQRKIFCLSKQGHLFCAWKFLKQYVTVTGKCEYVAMIRRITPPAGTKIQYMILTEDWEIDSMSGDFYDGFGLNALQYQSPTSKLIMSLLVLSPRLIRYTKFVKYLTEIDYKQFQTREQKERKKLASPSNVKGFVINNLFSKFKKDSYQNNNMQSQEINSRASNSLILDISPMSQQQQGNKNQYNLFTQAAAQAQQQMNQANSKIAPSINVTEPMPDDFNRNGKKKQTVIASTIGEESAINEADRLYAGLDHQATLDTQQQKQSQNQDQLFERKNSTNEILEQLNLGKNQQLLQPNFIREEMLKKKHREDSQQSGSFVDDDELDAPVEVHSSAYEDESNDQFDDNNDEQDEDEEGNVKKFAFEKLDLFERGDQVNFRMRIPTNFTEMMTSYCNRVTQISKKQPKTEKKNTQMSNESKTVGSRTMKHAYQNSETGGVTSFGKTGIQVTHHHDSRDKQIYSAIRDTIIGFQLKKSKKEFAGTCSASFKKSGKQRIIILKFMKMEECVKKSKSFKSLAHAAVHMDDHNPKKLLTLTSSLMDPFQKQASNVDRNKRMNQYQSMQSDFSEVQSSIMYNNLNNNKEVNNSFNMNNLIIATPGGGGGSVGTPENSKIASDTEDFIKMQVDKSGLKSPHEQSSRIKKLNGMGYQLASEYDEVASNNLTATDARSVKALFHKDFMNRQGSKNISLSQSENIYIKEDNHRPNDSIQTIENLKTFLRLFFLILIALNAFTFFYGPNYQFPILREQSNKIFQTKNVLLSALQAYDYTLDQIMVNYNNYDAAIASNTFWTETTYQTLIHKLFADECNYFYGISSDTDFKQTFFDSTINPYAEYEKNLFSTTTIPSGFVQKVFDVDTYDLFSQLVFSMQTVQETSPTEVTLALQPVDFFRINIFPNFYNGLKTMQSTLMQELSTTTNSVYSFLIIMIIVESFLILVSFILLFHMIIVICNALKSIVEAFPMISYRDLRKIKYYNIHLNQNFSYIIERDDYLSGTHSIFTAKPAAAAAAVAVTPSPSNNPKGNKGGDPTEIDGTENGIKKKLTENFDLDEPSDGTENIGKKSKDVTDGGFLKELRTQILSFFGVFIFFVGLSSAGLLLLILQSTSNLQLVLSNGEVFLDSFGDNVAMMIAIKEKTLAPTYYTSTFQTNVQPIIDAYLVKNLQPHVSNLSFMSFDDDFNTIFYNNPCTQFEQLLDQEAASELECISVALSSLTKGVASFNAFFKNAIQNYIAGTDDTITLDNTTIFEYSRGIYFVNIFEVQLIQNWGTNTTTYLSSQQSTIIVYVVLMFIVLFIVYLVITERMLIGRFSTEYTYFKTVYNMYMPDLIIQREKRVKFWLVKHFILNK